MSRANLMAHVTRATTVDSEHVVFALLTDAYVRDALGSAPLLPDEATLGSALLGLSPQARVPGSRQGLWSSVKESLTGGPLVFVGGEARVVETSAAVHKCIAEGLSRDLSEDDSKLELLGCLLGASASVRQALEAAGVHPSR
jgi:hypothetical protein